MTYLYSLELLSKPINLEKREGPFHLYKGHAVRKNIAEHYGLDGLQEWDGSEGPWCRRLHSQIRTLVA